MGLREVKKEQTRRHLAEVAGRLFAERGFDRVTVAEVAREAQVAEATVFNYFPAKEDLFYSRFESFESSLVAAVRDRAPGETALAAFRGRLLQTGGLLAQVATDPEAWERLRTLNRVISGSAALRTREQRVMAEATVELSGVLAAEPGGDAVTAYVVANALMGVHRALIDHVRRAVAAGVAPGRIAAETTDVGVRAFDLLATGLGGES
ncbi:TetR family transcriptional regulator [Hamadaea sp. NPDC050747]|uniref:TetR/AcrR family transcriptional regulator n=1 Tax=Hamadaea sp. NPDC050747 TaxID=3155789 RepID=UPI00340FDDC3